MSDNSEALARIAAALDRLAPPPAEPLDWNAAPAHVWSDKGARAVADTDALPLSTLRGIDTAKTAVISNLTRLSQGGAAHDMLLWGARGMGKSALIRAAVADIQHSDPQSLGLVQLSPDGLGSTALLIEALAAQPRPMLIFLDDLGFAAGQKQDSLALRSLLDGGVISRPAHIRLAVTSNHRGIVVRDAPNGEVLHERDERDDALALADRFGLKLAFHPCDRDTYLDILSAYTEPLGLAFDHEEALAWAITQGNRSGRTAYQFAVELAGRAGKTL